MRARALVLAALLLGPASAVARPGDWSRFGYRADRRNAGPRRTGITAANVATLRRQEVDIGGTADSSPVYLGHALVGGARHDVFFVTTSYGLTLAVDAASGTLLWRFTPEAYASWAGSAQITHASPVTDPGRRFVYAAAPDGRIHKLAVADGSEVRDGGWPVAVTLDPTHEKIGPALNLARGLVLTATGGYIGDAPPYQGHVAAIDAATGQLVHVWNSLCSDRAGLLDPPSCPDTRSAIWARAGVVVDPVSGNLLVATGNGRFDGSHAWGDSVLLLSPDAGRLLRNWTPTDQAELDRRDADLGSTAPALVGHGLAVQGGKDGLLRVLQLARLNGRTADAGPTTGGALQSIPTPGGQELFTAPAVWRNGGRTWVFVADGAATAGYVLARGRLARQWEVPAPGTSPVVAGGLLWVYDPGGALDVYEPMSGKTVTALPAGHGHWSSPIVTDRRVALPEGDANQHRTSGILAIYRLP